MNTMMTRPQAGTVEDLERDDDAGGYERDETDALHRLIKLLVADGDRRAAAAGRRARRTRAEMKAGPRCARECSACGGAGGHVEQTTDGGTVRQTWRTCGACRGTGVA
ncbi:hypothetical protein [Streptomyces youssoufiensis]